MLSVHRHIPNSNLLSSARVLFDFWSSLRGINVGPFINHTCNYTCTYTSCTAGCIGTYNIHSTRQIRSSLGRAAKYLLFRIPYRMGWEGWQGLIPGIDHIETFIAIMDGPSTVKALYSTPPLYRILAITDRPSGFMQSRIARLESFPQPDGRPTTAYYKSDCW